MRATANPIYKKIKPPGGEKRGMVLSADGWEEGGGEKIEKENSPCLAW